MTCRISDRLVVGWGYRWSPGRKDLNMVREKWRRSWVTLRARRLISAMMGGGRSRPKSLHYYAKRRSSTGERPPGQHGAARLLTVIRGRRFALTESRRRGRVNAGDIKVAPRSSCRTPSSPGGKRRCTAVLPEFATTPGWPGRRRVTMTLVAMGHIVTTIEGVR